MTIELIEAYQRVEEMFPRIQTKSLSAKMDKGGLTWELWLSHEGAYQSFMDSSLEIILAHAFAWNKERENPSPVKDVSVTQKPKKDKEEK